MAGLPLLKLSIRLYLLGSFDGLVQGTTKPTKNTIDFRRNCAQSICPFIYLMEQYSQIKGILRIKKFYDQEFEFGLGHTLNKESNIGRLGTDLFA
jgi:hypothetical protein